MALAALIVSIVAALGVIASALFAFQQGRTSKKAIEKEAADRGEELNLLRAQVEAAVEDRADRRRAYVSVDQRESSGGEREDSYTFEVINAGPSMVRHATVRIDQENAGLIARGKVEPHVLGPHEHGRAWLRVPRQLRGTPLTFVIQWVDAEQTREYDENGISKERVVGPLEPVSR